MKKRWKDFLHADIAVLFLSGVLLVLFAVSELYRSWTTRLCPDLSLCGVCCWF